MNNEQVILSITEAAKFLGVSRQTIYNMIKDGRLNPSSTITIDLGTKFILMDELRRFKCEKVKNSVIN